MGGLLAGGSVIAAFFAGAVALFSPCCIVFLLPAYLAAGVKNRRWRLLPLTLVFALGLATVLVPVTLGIGLLASALTRFHGPLYIGGGLLLLGLAVLSVLGRSWSLPSFVRAPDLEDRADTAAVYSLGVFSGIASSCCAPVLAGVMTLSALAGSPPGAFALGVAYVFGMTFPLFVMALVWDRLQLGDRRFLRARPVELRFGRLNLSTNSLNLAVAVAFAVMGGVVLYLGVTGETMAAPGAQLAVGRWVGDAAQWALDALAPVPEPVRILGLLAIAGVFIVAGRSRHRPAAVADRDPERRSCHYEPRHNTPPSDAPDRQGSHSAP